MVTESLRLMPRWLMVTGSYWLMLKWREHQYTTSEVRWTANKLVEWSVLHLSIVHSPYPIMMEGASVQHIGSVLCWRWTSWAMSLASLDRPYIVYILYWWREHSNVHCRSTRQTVIWSWLPVCYLCHDVKLYQDFSSLYCNDINKWHITLILCFLFSSDHCVVHIYMYPPNL